jgi:ABC-type uncharacterized transport system substrate-binding protein
LRQLELDRLASFPLTNDGPIIRIPIGRDVFDPQCNDIAAAQLAVDCQVEHCQVAYSSLQLQFGSDRPDVLIGLQPELIVTQTTPVTTALQRETRTIPIVFTRVSDPVGFGFVSSLARPGGNLTGLLQYEPGIVGKWLAMLKEIAPRIANVAFMGAGQADPAYNYFLQSAKTAASPLGIEVVPSPVSNDADIEHSLAASAQLSNAGLLVAPSTLTIAHRDLIITLAARLRLPAVYPWRFFVTAGGLMSYGIDDVELLRDAASYVDRILRGAKAAELPVQAPTKYQTVVNLKTAKAIGLDVPASLLVRADEVIE